MVAPKRVEFIDLLRGWAVIVMIETHVMNATLTQETMAGSVFQFLKFLNGLVAPSFLFASGMAYAVTTRRKLNDYLSFGPPLFKQIGRLLFILALGYMLHLPKFNFTHLLHLAGERPWQVFFQSDVLHCIAVSLLIMQGLLLLLKNERRLYATVGGLALVIVIMTPVMWGIDFWKYLPVPIAAYMNGQHFSLFPLFPWSAFLFAGAIAGYFYLRAKDVSASKPQGREPKMMKSLAWVALGIIAISFAFEPVAASIYSVYDYWRFSPSFFLLRLGLVLLLCSGMFFYERYRGVSARSPITLVGRESLLVYTAHLLLIFGNFGAFNFRDRVNHTYGYMGALITTLILLVLMYVLARTWNRIKHSSLRLKLAVNLGTLASFLGVFFFGPGE